MTTYYFTYGSGMHDTHGRSLLGWYTTIKAETENEARKIYAARYGSKWAFTYTDPGFQEQIEQYNLQYIPFEDVELCCGAEQEEYLKLQVANHEP